MMETDQGKTFKKCIEGKSKIAHSRSLRFV